MKKANTARKTAGRSTIIDVKVAQLGTPVIEVTLERGQTVRHALKAAGIKSTNVTVKCSGRKVSLDDLPENGDRLTIADPVKGA